MNKTISINLGGRNFFIEESAYHKLDGYLIAIKKRFEQYPGSGEIVADMESRIGEKFWEKYQNNSQAVIVEADVDSLIGELGTVDDIAGDQGTRDKSDDKAAGPSFAPKRLMRNGDDKIIAGVCSGLAAYFDADPFVFRLVFGLLIFAWGTIIPIYLLLWLIMPEAKTATEKMQMRGEPLNINSIGETIKERAEEFKQRVHEVRDNKEWRQWQRDVKDRAKTMREDFRQSRREWREGRRGAPYAANLQPTADKVQNPPNADAAANPVQVSSATAGRPKSGFGGFVRDLFAGIGKIIIFVISLLRRVISLALIVAFGLAIAGVTLGFAVAVSGSHSPYLRLPLEVLPHTAAFYVLLILAYIIILIPLQFLLLAAVAVFGGRRAGLRASVGFSLFAVWLAALIAGGALGARYVPDYVYQIKNSRDYWQSNPWQNTSTSTQYFVSPPVAPTPRINQPPVY